jgi:hypothetical protein
MPFPYEEFDLSDVRTYPLATRPSKAQVANFARPCPAGGRIGDLIASLPDTLAAADLRAVIDALREARRSDGGILWGLGAHVIKTGLGPVLIDLMDRGYVSGIATNGAAIIHDFEVALAGATSEDVDAALGPGRFVGRFLQASQPPFARYSVVTAAAQRGIPVTVHVAIGTDITHMHPAASGEAIGAGSLRDFRYFAANVARLEHGVYLNCGSAVVLPEVFLKAVALARNRGAALSRLTTVNLDFVRLYRPQMNVVTRPTAESGRGYSLVGHHEIMLPLLAAALVDADATATDGSPRG